MKNQKVDVAHIYNEISNSIQKLHKVGGLSLVLSGVALILISILILLPTLGFASDVIRSLPTSVYYLLLAIIILGASIWASERYLEFKIANQKLQMMMNLTEIMVKAAIPKNDALGPEKIREIINGAFNEIWNYSIISSEIPEKRQNKTDW